MIQFTACGVLFFYYLFFYSNLGKCYVEMYAGAVMKLLYQYHEMISPFFLFENHPRKVINARMPVRYGSESFS